jgi:hypothetical protein
VKDGATTPNATLELWEPLPDNMTQEWKIVPVDHNKFKIINRKSGLVMTGNGHVNRLIQQPENATSTAQQWYIEPIGNGTYGLINVKSGYAIDNTGGHTANGTAAIEYNLEIMFNLNQQWHLKKTEALESTKQHIAHSSTLSISGFNGLLSVNGLEGKNTVSVYTITGQLVFSSECNDSQFMLELSPGSYILAIRGNSYYRGVVIVR